MTEAELRNTSGRGYKLWSLLRYHAHAAAGWGPGSPTTWSSSAAGGCIGAEMQDRGGQTCHTNSGSGAHVKRARARTGASGVRATGRGSICQRAGQRRGDIRRTVFSACPRGRTHHEHIDPSTYFAAPFCLGDGERDTDQAPGTTVSTASVLEPILTVVNRGKSATRPDPMPTMALAIRPGSGLSGGRAVSEEGGCWGDPVLTRSGCVLPSRARRRAELRSCPR